MGRIGRRVGTGLFAVSAALAVAGCAGGPIRGPIDDSRRKPLEQSFQPPYGNAPAAGRIERLEDGSLSADHLTLTVRFVGSKGFVAGDPCSEDYTPWVAPNGAALDVAVVELPNRAVSFGGGCTLEGYGYTFHLGLEAPFAGSTVNDRGGGTILVGAPKVVAGVHVLPTGWSLLVEHEAPGQPSVWTRVYGAAQAVRAGDEGPGALVLYQVDGPYGEWSDARTEKSRERGGRPLAVTFHDELTMLWRDDSTGELLLAWELGGRSYGLIGNLADFTPDAFMASAESVAIP